MYVQFISVLYTVYFFIILILFYIRMLLLVLCVYKIRNIIVPMCNIRMVLILLYSTKIPIKYSCDIPVL